MRQLSILLVASLFACTPIDVDRGYGFSCKRDSSSTTQCPGDFHCGLENKCIQNAPGAWQCESDIDCYGWHCGVEKRCYDLADAGGVGCVTDTDCDAVGGWRCSPDLRCVSAAADALVPPAPITDVFRTTSIDFWSGTATHVEAIESGFGPVNGEPCRSRRMTVAAGDELVEIYAPQGSFSCVSSWNVSRTALPRPRSIARHGTTLGVLAADGSMIVFTVAGDGGFTRSSPSVPAGLTHLRVDSAGFLAFNSEMVVGVALDGGTWTAKPDAGGLIDVDAWFSRDAGDLLFLTDGGLFQSTYVPGVGLVTEPTVGSLLPNGCVRASELTGVHRLDERRLVAARGFTSATELKMYVPSETLQSECPLLQSPFSSWKESFASFVSGDCAATMPLATNGEYRWQCLLADGGVAITGASENVQIGSPMTTRNATSRDSVAFAGGPRALWFGAEFSFSPAFLDRTPSALSVWGDSVVALAEQNDVASQTAFGALLSRGSTLTFPIGSLQNPISVRGQSTWFAGSQFDTAVIGRFTLDDYGFGSVALVATTSPLTSAATTSLADGGTLIVVGAGDLLMHGAMTSLDGGLSNVLPAVVPSSRLPITALSPRSDALGARYAGGYLVAGGRLFRFTADNPVVWRSEELIASDQEAIDVWTQAGRSRAGYRDGTIVGLPSRVRIAAASASPVIQFIPACERVFAITNEGISQLVAAEGDREGHWDAVFARSGGGRGIFAHGKLTVVWSDGSYGELPVTGCNE